MDWLTSERDMVWYIVLIICFFTFFIWNNLRLKRNRNRRKEHTFKSRYSTKKSERNS